jgi:DNA-binding response OmpR family regulator
MKVVLVGGGEELCATLRVILRVRWRELELQWIVDSRACASAVRREEPSLVLVAIDEIAPCCDLIAEVRSFSNVPLIVVGLNEDPGAKVRVLEMGADDWIHPSCIPMEFIARVNALLRRCETQQEQCPYLNDGLCIDFATQEVRVNGRCTELTPTEFKVLCRLAKNYGSVVTSERLLCEVWGGDGSADPEFVKKYIHRLRTKLEHDPADPRLIVNRRGVGYMLAAPR